MLERVGSERQGTQQQQGKLAEQLQMAQQQAQTALLEADAARQREQAQQQLVAQLQQRASQAAQAAAKAAKMKGGAEMAAPASQYMFSGAAAWKPLLWRGRGRLHETWWAKAMCSVHQTT